MPSVITSSATTEGAAATGGSLGRFRAEFPTAPSAQSGWDVVTGAGMTLTPAQTTTGTVLAVALGTTVAAESALISRQTFTAPMKVAASIQLSQKIVNQSVHLELVGLNPDGSLDETSVIAWRFSGDDGTNAAQATVQTQNGGAARVGVLNQTVPTYVAGTLTSNAPPTTFEIEHLADEVWFHTRSSDAITGRVNSYSRTTVLPDSAAYKLRLRLTNGGTAPAAGTTVWVGHVTVDAHTEMPVEVVSSRGSSLASQALGVQVVGTPTVNVGANQTLGVSANASQTAPSIVRFDALLATPQTVKASANALLYWASIFNPNAAMAAVHFYNTTSGEVVGTTVPVLTIAVPANQTVVLPAGAIPYLKNATGLRVVATTTATTAGAVAPTTGLSVTVGYL